MSTKKSNSKVIAQKVSGKRIVATNKASKDENNTEKRLSREYENFTIRLSELGDIKRSPSEAERQIQHGRISDVVAKTIDKLKITLSLPYLLERDAAVLHQYFTNTEVQYIQNVCTKYTHPYQGFRPSAQFQNFTAVVDKISLLESKAMRESAEEMGFDGQKKYQEVIDPHMAQVVGILWKSCSLKRHVIINFEKIVDFQSIRLVRSLEQLKQIAEKKVAINAREQRAHEYRLSQAWQRSPAAQENIERLQRQLEKQRQDLGIQVKTNLALAEDYKNRIEGLKENVKDEIVKITASSEKGMFEQSYASNLRQVTLASDAKNSTHQYDTLVTQHMVYEKALRAKRLKVETQLASWLTKFDADIGERHAEFEKLEQGYLEEKGRFDELQEKFNEQLEEYEVLMAEKEKEEQRIFEEQAYEFLRNRSARRIQRTWRAYRQRKIDRKRAKKEKAKKKKEVAEGREAGVKPPKKEQGGKGKNKKGKGKKGKKDAAEGTPFRGPDPMAALEKKFGGDIFGDLQGNDFKKEDVVVDLAAN